MKLKRFGGRPSVGGMRGAKKNQSVALVIGTNEPLNHAVFEPKMA